MKSLMQEHVIGFPINSSIAQYLFDRQQQQYLLPATDCQYIVRSPADGSITIRRRRVKSMLHGINKLGKNLKRVENFADRVLEHVRLGPKVSDIVKGKLILGARILQVGGVEKIFKQCFSVRGGENLLKVSQCYLSTTSGPIAGLLFISNDKIAFRSERSMKLSSPNGESVRFHYKVVIPLSKIKRVDQSENVKKPSQKYIEIVTTDNFDFWFMGFLNYQKSIGALQQAISQRLENLAQVTSL